MMKSMTKRKNRAHHRSQVYSIKVDVLYNFILIAVYIALLESNRFCKL